MLEWLATIGAAKLGEAIFEQVLKLGQSAAEDYVKDFFKGCLKEGIASAKPEVAKKAVAEALKAFLLIVSDELEDQDLSRAEIRDRYDPALIQFVQDESVKPLLGKSFEKDCGVIDMTALATIWQQSSLRGKPFPILPEEFDWRQIGSKYLKKVRRIVRETPELRSLLETELLEEIARNTMQLSPGFDVAKYRESLQCSYGHLKLYAIDSTDRVDAVKLWNMFIEQTVREALPPTRHELPSDLKRQLQATGQLETDLSADALEQYRGEYFQQPSRKVLKAVAEAQLAVLLGDPGAGKSTLLQYLALEWVEGKTELLPLLIELREYAISQVDNFLDFLHRGRGVDWQFDQQQLHQHLQEHSTLVMFDGLDEVFDRATQSAIIDDMIRFAQQYPKAQILITSRIIGYNPERLRHANFRHFTIQPLDTDEIHEFIDRWYTLALGNDADKSRLVTRLKDAIANSKAIQNLADNPLLLTMMAILNRRQELPRDRADLYDQASRVLLYHWDVDHKRLRLPMDAIGRREKQEMLRAIAYEMQTSEEGLKGNLISADRLTRILTDYLRDQDYEAPREKANGLIDQLRHRNWILCDRGADTYGFVHRTFLEYFCAIEIVHRFERSRTLTFEQLRDEVFGQHWQDETWHEVLRLICGMIDEKIAGILISYLMSEETWEYKYIHLFLAAECLHEVKNRSTLTEISTALLGDMKSLVDGLSFSEEASLDVYDFAQIGVAQEAVRLISQIWKDDPDTLFWLKACAELDYGSEYMIGVRLEAIQGLIRDWKDNPDTLLLLETCAQYDASVWLRQTVVKEIAKGLRNDSSGLILLCNVVINHNSDKDYPNETTVLVNPRLVALISIVENYSTHPKTLELLHDRAANDPDEQLRQWAREQLKSQAVKLQMENMP